MVRRGEGCRERRYVPEDLLRAHRRAAVTRPLQHVEQRDGRLLPRAARGRLARHDVVHVELHVEAPLRQPDRGHRHAPPGRGQHRQLEAAVGLPGLQQQDARARGLEVLALHRQAVGERDLQLELALRHALAAHDGQLKAARLRALPPVVHGLRPLHALLEQLRHIHLSTGRATLVQRGPEAPRDHGRREALRGHGRIVVDARHRGQDCDGGGRGDQVEEV